MGASPLVLVYAELGVLRRGWGRWQLCSQVPDADGSVGGKLFGAELRKGGLSCPQHQSDFDKLSPTLRSRATPPCCATKRECWAWLKDRVPEGEWLKEELTWRSRGQQGTQCSAETWVG